MDQREKNSVDTSQNERPKSPLISRRSFLKGASVTVVGVGALTAGCAPTGETFPAAEQITTALPVAQQYPAVPVAPAEPPAPGLLRYFPPHETQTVEALTVRILPGTPDDPGAREAGVVYQFFDLDPNYTDVYGRPLLRLTFDFHQNDYNLYRFIAARCKEIMQQMAPTRYSFTPELEPFNVHSYQSTHITGGAIMGSDPGNSVTNKYGQVWDTPNVFVTGAALYPQNPGLNPTGPLLALTYLAGDGILQRYLNEPGAIIT